MYVVHRQLHWRPRAKHKFVPVHGDTPRWIPKQCPPAMIQFYQTCFLGGSYPELWKHTHIYSPCNPCNQCNQCNHCNLQGLRPCNTTVPRLGNSEQPQLAASLRLQEPSSADHGSGFIRSADFVGAMVSRLDGTGQVAPVLHCFAKCRAQCFWHRNHQFPGVVRNMKQFRFPESTWGTFSNMGIFAYPASSAFGKIRGVTHPVVLGHHRSSSYDTVPVYVTFCGQSYGVGGWHGCEADTTYPQQNYCAAGSGFLGWEDATFSLLLHSTEGAPFIFFQIRIVSGLVPSTLEAPLNVWVVFSLLIMDKLQYASSCWIVPWHLQNRLPQGCQPPKFIVYNQALKMTSSHT